MLQCHRHHQDRLDLVIAIATATATVDAMLGIETVMKQHGEDKLKK